MSVDVLSAASTIITMLLGFLYTVILTARWRFSAKTMQWLIPAFLVSLSLADVLVFMVWGVDEKSKVFAALVNIAAILAFNLIFSASRAIQMLFSHTSASIFLFISDTLTGVLSPEPGLRHVLTKTVVYLVIALLLFCFFRRPFLDVLQEMQKKWLWVMVIPPFVDFLFFFILQMHGPLYQNSVFRPAVLAISVCAICIYVSFYFVFCGFHRQFQMRADYDALQLHISSLKKHAETMQSMSEQMHLFQHDIRHFLQIQSVCLENGDLAGARKALDAMASNLDGALESRSMQNYTGRVLVDAVLSYYTGKAEANGIVIHIHFAVPKDVGDAAEFAVVLANALENAVNACCKIPAGIERKIKVVGGMKSSQFCLEVENTYDGRVSFDTAGYPVTTMAGHGYGTKSIVSFAKKHGAFLVYQAENNWFSLRLLLPVEALGIERPLVNHLMS